MQILVAIVSLFLVGLSLDVAIIGGALLLAGWYKMIRARRA